MLSPEPRRTSILLSLLLLIFCAVPACTNDSDAPDSSTGADRDGYDLIIRNGRVIDPETGRDEIATVAVRGSTIRKIAAGGGQNLSTTEYGRVLDASGLVVSPGFINTHTHEGNGVFSVQLYESAKAYVQDGITFWLGGNCGLSPTGMVLELNGRIVDNRIGLTFPEFMDKVESEGLLSNNYAPLSGNLTLRGEVGCAHGEPESDSQIAGMLDLLERDLAAGAFGVSYGPFYDPGTTERAMKELAMTSRAAGGMAASHIRDVVSELLGVVLFRDSLLEAIRTCREADIPYLVSHLTDMTYNGSTQWALETIERAVREEGLPLAADIIGYDTFKNDLLALTRFGQIPVRLLMFFVGVTADQFFMAEDVYVDDELYMEAYKRVTTIGQIETLTRAFEEGRARAAEGSDSISVNIWCDIVKPEYTIMSLKRPFVFMGNDGGVSRNPSTNEIIIQPRTLSCFSRLLGRWSREHGAISLEEAVFKATIAPALWLGLDKKGRLQEGCDADITVFDPDTIIDRAKPEPDKLDLPPEGIRYVIVNGQIVVEEGELTGNTPGRLIRRTWTIPGDTEEVISLYEGRF
jgi:N-acyl-D-amino-acid deacylase